jgi:hypothetical protein
MDNQGLEAGLSFIGLVLESAERRIAEFWAAYEERNPSRRSIATIKYPDRYSLKTDADRIEEASKLSELMTKVPGRTVKRELAKSITSTLLSGKTPVDRLDAIYKEIDDSKFTTSDPTTIIQASGSRARRRANRFYRLGLRRQRVQASPRRSRIARGSHRSRSIGSQPRPNTS